SAGEARGARRAASCITQSKSDHWHKKHRDWKVVDKAEQRTGAAMIEVPRIEVAGYEVGPVWFTARADKNFHEFMSQWMDRTVEGALGGSGLRFFRVTVDYPHAAAYFEKP